MDELLYNMARKIHERHTLFEGANACRECWQEDTNGNFIFPCDAARLASVLIMTYMEQDEST